MLSGEVWWRAGRSEKTAREGRRVAPLNTNTTQHGMKPTAAVNSDTGTAQVSVQLDDGASLMRSEPTGMTLLSWLSSTAPVVSPIAAGEGTAFLWISSSSFQPQHEEK